MTLETGMKWCLLQFLGLGDTSPITVKKYASAKSNLLQGAPGSVAKGSCLSFYGSFTHKIDNNGIKCKAPKAIIPIPESWHSTIKYSYLLNINSPVFLTQLESFSVTGTKNGKKIKNKIEKQRGGEKKRTDRYDYEDPII